LCTKKVVESEGVISKVNLKNALLVRILLTYACEELGTANQDLSTASSLDFISWVVWNRYNAF